MVSTDQVCKTVVLHRDLVGFPSAYLPFSSHSPLKTPKPKELARAINHLNRFACLPQVSSVQHSSPSPDYSPLLCPTFMGCKCVSMWPSEVQLTHGQVMMRPWLSNRDCCQMQVVRDLDFGMLDGGTLNWAALLPHAVKQRTLNPISIDFCLILFLEGFGATLQLCFHISLRESLERSYREIFVILKVIFLYIKQ